MRDNVDRPIGIGVFVIAIALPDGDGMNRIGIVNHYAVPS